MSKTHASWHSVSGIYDADTGDQLFEHLDRSTKRQESCTLGLRRRLHARMETFTLNTVLMWLHVNLQYRAEEGEHSHNLALETSK